ncbi:MAG: hypothetical protein SAL70_35905 [Scytonema sp. PMC 1070.18]|nr:hypothetical protein [Scytonema sp. PMC 1070.18]
MYYCLKLSLLVSSDEVGFTELSNYQVGDRYSQTQPAIMMTNFKF